MASLNPAALKAALSARYHGIPGWGLALGIAGAAYLLLPRLGGLTAALTGGTAAGSASSSTSGGSAGLPGSAGGDLATASRLQLAGTSSETQGLGNLRYNITGIITQGLGNLRYTPPPAGSVSRPAGLTPSAGPVGTSASTSGDTGVTRGVRPLGFRATGGPANGSRSADLFEDHHPALRRVVHYPHFVRAVGGPSRHMDEIARIAAATGIHPARLIALNPEATGMIRVA